MLMSVSARVIKCCTVPFSNKSCSTRHQAEVARRRCAAAYSWQQRFPLRVPGTDFGVVGGRTQPGHKDGKPSEDQRVMRMVVVVVVVMVAVLLLLLLLVVVVVM